MRKHGGVVDKGGLCGPCGGATMPGGTNVLESQAKVERVQRTPDGGWQIHAPAKLNLGLRVYPARPDGFHDLETWMVPLSWHDTLTYRPEEPLGLRIVGRAEGIPTDMEKNLVGQALLKLAARAGRNPGGCMELHKVLPPGGGMGGGSSDAANALVLLSAAWNLRIELKELEAVAAELGSDVPFFVHGKQTLCKGRGEIMTSLCSCQVLFAVLILPPQGLATKPVFEAFDAEEWREANEIPWCQWAGLPAKELNNVLINDLEPAAFKLAPWLACLRADASKAAGQKVHMTGSGSTLFTLGATGQEASALSDRLNEALAERATCVPVRILRNR